MQLDRVVAENADGDRLMQTTAQIDAQRRFLERREFLKAAGAVFALGAVQACGAPGAGAGAGAALADGQAVLQLPKLRVGIDRITRITVCTRPFRAQGPRTDVEKIGAKTVVHNYGHGGSGWSLSWGAAQIAAASAMATGERDVAVVGAGAMGLTTAIALQRAGARVAIYAKDLPPDVRSSWATGLYTPDSRIAMEEHATPEFKQTWAKMARYTYEAFQSFLGVAGNPVEYIDQYGVSDEPGPRQRHEPEGKPKFAELQRELTPDLMPTPVEFNPGTHPFGQRYVRRNSQLMFNLASYQRILMQDFEAVGGRFEIVEFKTPADFARIKEKTLVNCTGYGARALLGDTSVVPVRGQITRLISQIDANYGVRYKDTAFVPRRDGLLLQVAGDSDYYGYDDESTTPNREEAEHAVTTIASLWEPAAAAPAGEKRPA
jgi:glycine/D-amino acid oxidase-like deaminating enzyme